MKKQYNALRKLIFSLVLLFAGVQGVFASMACTGTVYFKLPDGWKSAYAVGGGQKAAFTKSDYDGWLKVSATNIGGPNAVTGFFIEETGANDCNSGHCVRRDSMDVTYMQMSEAAGFKCADFSSEDDKGELWIQAHPDPSKEGVTYKSQTPPDVKYFYIFLPNNATWKSSIPMMSVDGKPGESLTADPDRCGWYFRRFIDEDPPSSVLIYRDDDELMAEAIGMNGDWEEAETPTPINLETLFEFLGSDNIYFVAAQEFADESNPNAVGWTTTDPGVAGDCGYDLAAMIYDTDASLHGAFTCNPDWFSGQTAAQAHANACYYASAKYNVVSSGTAEVPCIGITPGMVTDLLDAKTKKPALSASGKKCFGSSADEAFAAMFNYTEGVNENYCFNLPFTQTEDGKYEFDSDNYQSPGAKVAGGFYPAEETPDASMFVEGTKPLPQAESKRKAEGPVFFCADYNNQMTSSSEGLRTIDASEGVPKSDLVCNGPGWDGGVDCEGYYAAGSEFYSDGALTAKGREIQKALGVSWEGDGWGWGCPNMAPVGWNFYEEGTETFVGKLAIKNQVPTGGNYRWTSGTSDADVLSNKGRNQHFCFESHANFRYKKGLRFSFRGDDDIWVYIDNKLAVDLGGTHLAAPGYVNLDKFVGASGGFTVGQTYDIDIFFCDRRTTMSNVRIKTNMFIQQTKGLKKQVVSKKQGVEVYQLVYSVSGDGSCGGASADAQNMTGAELVKYLEDHGQTIDYTITNKKGDVIKTAAELAESKVYFNGIDLTDRTDPKIDKNTLSGLPAGNYFLVATINGSKETFPFKVTGNLEVVSRFGEAQDDDGNKVGTYDVTKLSLATMDETKPTRVPIYISSVMDPGVDTEPLTIDISTAVGQTYTLEVKDSLTGAVSSDVTLEYKDANGEFQTWSGKTDRPVGEGGVDTIYASLSMAFMTNSEQTYTFAVTGHTVFTSVKFFAPKLVFVENDSSLVQVSGDPATDERWTGSMYNFYLVALAPSLDKEGYEPCGELCNFTLSVGTENSAGLIVDTLGMKLENGRARISVYSTKAYRQNSDGSCVASKDEICGDATLSITGPNATLVKAIYTPLHFRNPPVPYPIFADIFDVHGKTPTSEYIMKDPYFNMGQEYLDGIADSLVIYYNRQFYNSKDSLPGRVVVYWDGDKDSVVVTSDQFTTYCGASAGLDDTLCLARISISGVNFSKDVRTANENATLQSYATFMDRGKKVEEKFPGNINDRVAPLIIAADVRRRAESDVMTLTLSETVTLLDESFSKTSFTAYLNSAANLIDDKKYVEGVLAAQVQPGADKITLIFNGSDDNPTPHTGDYIRFRTDKQLWVDVATDVAGTDASLRPAEDAAGNWNSPTGYLPGTRLPTPWTPVTGEAEVGVKAIKYVEVNPDMVKNVPAEQIAISTVRSYPVTTTFDDIQKENPGLGYFMKSDMNSLVYSDTVISKFFNDPANAAEIQKIYLEFEMDIFSNLGNFVAHEVKKIQCTDATVFGEGHSCLDTQRNFFISWNGVSNEKRFVGTGAYISKMTSSVHLGKFGRKNKMEETQMWGLRRTKKAVQITTAN